MLLTFCPLHPSVRRKMMVASRDPFTVKHPWNASLNGNRLDPTNSQTMVISRVSANVMRKVSEDNVPLRAYSMYSQRGMNGATHPCCGCGRKQISHMKPDVNPRSLYL